MSLSPIEDIIEDIRQGKMVILMDDEDRENEGDLIMAASLADASHINYMARYGRGLICLTLTPDRCEQLALPLMVSDTNDKHATNFTVSIEAAQGVTTGISAAAQAATALLISWVATPWRRNSGRTSTALIQVANRSSPGAFAAVNARPPTSSPSPSNANNAQG